MRSNVAFGKKLIKISCHWKKIENNSNCAAICPLEKNSEKVKMHSNVPMGKIEKKIKM